MRYDNLRVALTAHTDYLLEFYGFDMSRAHDQYDGRRTAEALCISHKSLWEKMNKFVLSETQRHGSP